MCKDYSRYTPERKERILVFFAAFCGFTAVGYIFYGNLYFGAALPLLYPKIVKLYSKKKAEERKHRLLLQFRDFLYSLSASFATGRHMAEAMEEAESNLEEIYDAGSEMTGELRSMRRRIREAGETDLAVLADFARRSGLEDAADFVQVFGACRETGGNMILAVNKAAAVIGDKINIETEIRTMVSQKKLEGRIITAMPAAVVLFLQLASPDYLHVMYHTFAGRLLMSLALLTIVAAYVMIERITDIEV